MSQDAPTKPARPPWQDRICTFIEVKQPHDKNDPVTVLNRHSTPLEFVDIQSDPESVYIPISDRRIRISLEMAMLPHPFTLIGLLEKWDSPSDQDIESSLLPLHLYVEEIVQNTPDRGGLLIPQIAKIYHQTPDQFLVNFKGTINSDLINSSWRRIFEASSEDKGEIERQLQVFKANLVMTFPTPEFVLNTMDDLFSLHVLACSMNTRIYLILARSSQMNSQDTRASLLPHTVFCQPIGPQGAKYSLYVVVKSSTQFYIARPQLKEKKLRMRDSETQDNLLRTFETMNNKMAIYYVYKQEEDKEFKTIRTIPTEKLSVDKPCLKMEGDAESLNIRLELPLQNRDNHYLLMHLFESIGDEKMEMKTVRDTLQTTFQCRDVFRVVGAPSSSFVLTRKCKKVVKPLREFGKVRTESELYKLASATHKFTYSGISENGDLMDVHAFRLLESQIPARERKELGYDAPDCALPLFMPHATRWALSAFCSCPYAELLCLRSILRYGIGLMERVCPFCKEVIGKECLMIPFLDRETEEMRWICHECLYEKQKDKTKDEWRVIIYYIKQHFPMFTKIKNVDPLWPILDRVEENINTLRENPIGYLRQMIPLIDSAFRTFQKILFSYYRPIEGILLQKKQRRRRFEFLKAMMGIRDISEAKVHMGNLVLINSEDYPVDFKMFSHYLSIQSDVRYVSPQFRLIQSPARVLAELDYAVMERILQNYKEAPDKGLEYAMQVRPGKEFSIDFKLPGNTEDVITTEKYRYDIYPIVSAGHLALSSIASISTDLLIDNLWMFDKNRILILAHEKPIDSRYSKAFLYLINIGNVVLSSEEPIYKFPKKINILDCSFNKKGSCIAVSYENLEFEGVSLVTISRKTAKPKVVTLNVSAPTLAFGPGDQLYLGQTKDYGFSIVVWGEWEESFATVDTPHKLFGTPGYLIAIDQTGKLHRIWDSLDEDTAKDLPEVLRDFTSLSCPVFMTTMAENEGLALVPSIPFTGTEDRMPISFYKWPSPFKFTGANGVRQPPTMRFANQLGLPELPQQLPNRHLWNVHLTIAEFLPALIAYEHDNTMFCICNDMSHYHATRRHSFLPAAVSSFYARTVNAISLHHIEDVIIRHRLNVNIVGFMPLMDCESAASFIDSIFGTRFLSVDIPGIWLGMRIIDRTAHVIIFFKDMPHHDKFQLMSLYRGANVIELCTKKVVDTLNFVYEWQTESRRRNVLTTHDRFPKLEVSLFMPPGDASINEKAVFELHTEKHIASHVTKVPFRENWRTMTLDDIREGAREDESKMTFLRNWDNILNLRLQEIKSEFRAPHDPLLGVGVVKQIIGTYMTLLEFADAPAFTVLQYCTLSLRD